MVDDPDEVVDHVLALCLGCGAGLDDAEAGRGDGPAVRDVPLVRVRVVEHRMHKRVCGCGTVTSAAAPGGVDGPMCYGPNLRAVAVYLVVFQHVPVERAARLIADLTGAAVSTGWVSVQVARTARDQGLDHIPPTQAAEPLRLFRHAVLGGLAEHRRADGRRQAKARNLLERLRNREPEILRFTTDLAVPFTNKGSERDLRPVKTQLKISGCHRATTGAQAWLRVRGYISTVGKHGDDVLTALHDAITGQLWTPATPAT